MNIKKEIEERVSKIEYSESINEKDGSRNCLQVLEHGLYI